MTSSNVLILGATGHLGQHFPRALQERGHKVRALVRRETLASTDPAKQAAVDELRRRGVLLVEGDLQDEASLKAACQGMDVVISAVTGQLLGEQPKLFDAMRDAGVQRFVPSEFGFDPYLLDEGRCALGDWKRGVQAAVKASGVPYTMVYANGFGTYWAASLGQLGLFGPPADTIQMFGQGDVAGHFVLPEDIARYVAAVIDDPRTENREVGIFPEANRRTQNDLVTKWEGVTGKKLSRETVSAETVDAIIDGAAGDTERMVEWVMMQLVRAVWFDGVTDTRRDEVLEATKLYPALRYTRVDDFLAGLAQPDPVSTLSAPVRGYIEALSSGDAAQVSQCFAEDYRSDQPANPARAFCGRDIVERNYEGLFKQNRIRAHVITAHAAPADAAGVRVNYVELTFDLLGKDGKATLATGMMVCAATDDELRWGRLHVTPAAGEGFDQEIDALIENSRRA